MTGSLLFLALNIHMILLLGKRQEKKWIVTEGVLNIIQTIEINWEDIYLKSLQHTCSYKYLFACVQTSTFTHTPASQVTFVVQFQNLSEMITDKLWGWASELCTDIAIGCQIQFGTKCFGCVRENLNFLRKRLIPTINFGMESSLMR